MLRPSNAVILTLAASLVGQRHASRVWRDAYRIEFRHEVTARGGAARAVGAHLAVPFDTPDQRIEKLAWFMDGAEVRPKIDRDQFSQRVAIIELGELAGRQRRTVGYSCVVRFRPIARVELEADPTAPIPESISRRYTADVKSVYDLKHPDIVATAKRLVADKTYAEKILALHDFVAGHVTYAREKGWDAAPVVLERRTGSCSESSYLFGALCRAAGIPTRFAGGSIHRGDRDETYVDRIWHRWLQVWMPGQGWVHLDATASIGAPVRRRYVGSYRDRSFVVSHGGGGRSVLRNHYLSASAATGAVSTRRSFRWTPLARPVPAAAGTAVGGGR